MSIAKPRNTKIIGVGNQKGGVGKTATTVHLAAALGELGRKSLIWDLDSNMGATNAFLIPGNVYSGSLEVMLGEKDPGEKFCDPTKYIVDEEEEGINLPKGVHILPASRELDNFKMKWEASDRRFLDPRDALRDPLERLKGHYDYIFLDTGPNVSDCTTAAYKTAEWFLLVSEPEPLSVRAVEAALADLSLVQEQANPNLNILGIVLTCVTKRRALDRKMGDWLAETYKLIGDYGVFEETISRTTFLPRSQASGETMFQTHPDHEVTEQFRRLARAMEARLTSYEKETTARKVAKVG